MQKVEALEAVAHKRLLLLQVGQEHQDKEIMVVMVTTLQVAAAEERKEEGGGEARAQLKCA